VLLVNRVVRSFDSAGPFLALWSNEKGGIDVADSRASGDKPALFLRSWVVNAFGFRTNYHNGAIDWFIRVFLKP
jgi:hypothetical protein